MKLWANALDLRTDGDVVVRILEVDEGGGITGRDPA